ncbi:MAG: hypothetical protein EOO54_27590 [Haliea sp.]|nr:MAG: hypothetical protein EOO54_27590 [Haliea sp.]
MQASSRIRRFFGTAGQADPARAEAEQALLASRKLQALREAMLLVLEPCSEMHRLRASIKIGRASSVMELWMMRADVFQYLAKDLGQAAALQKIAGLTPLFTGLAPGVAGPRQTADNRRHDLSAP